MRDVPFICKENLKLLEYRFDSVRKFIQLK